MKALQLVDWKHAPGFRDVPEPEPGPGEVVVKVGVPVPATPDAALTPYHAIKRSLSLLVPGSTAVVIGAGGLGHMAVQILRAPTPRSSARRQRSACSDT